MAEKPDAVAADELLERFMSAAYEGKVGRSIDIVALLTMSTDLRGARRKQRRACIAREAQRIVLKLRHFRQGRDIRSGLEWTLPAGDCAIE